MEKEKGIVQKVFVPTDYDGKVIDKLYSTKVGFEVEVDDKIVTIVQEQNDVNTDIFREDKVWMIKEDDEYIDIELYDGE